MHRKTAYLPPGWLRRERDRRHRPAPSGRCAWTRRAIDESGFGRLEVLVPGVVDAGLLRVPADIDDTAAGERSAAAAPKLDDARRLLATTLRSVLAGALVDVTAGSARPVVVGEVGGLPVDVANVEPDAVREAVAGLGSSAAGLKVLSRRLQVAQLGSLEINGRDAAPKLGRAGNERLAVTTGSLTGLVDVSDPTVPFVAKVCTPGGQPPIEEHAESSVPGLVALGRLLATVVPAMKRESESGWPPVHEVALLELGHPWPTRPRGVDAVGSAARGGRRR